MSSDFSVVSWGFLGGLATAALVCWVAWRYLQRRRYRSVAYVALATAVFLSSASAASAANRYFSYLPHLGDVVSVVDGERNWADFSTVSAVPLDEAARRYPDGAVVHLDVADRGSDFGATRALVYLPPQYFTEPSRRFAVTYLFHGSPGVPGDWFRGGQAATLGARLAANGQPVILVAPRMSHGWLDDPECVDGIGEKVETHLLRDVIPAVDGSLRTVPTRDARAFGGMSAGGYCALNLGLRNRALVSTILDMSGFTRPTHDGGLAPLFGTGPSADETIRANSPAEYAPTLDANPPTRVWLDCGTGDHEVLGQLRSMRSVLADRGLDVRLETRPGGHTFHVWRPALADAMEWAAPQLVAATQEQPAEGGH